MIYESSHAGHRLLTGGQGHVEFAPGPKRNDQGDQFGVLDTSSKVLQASCGMDAEQLQAFIEGGAAYRTRRIGLSGIWRQEDRIAHEGRVNTAAMRTTFVRNMTVEQLRGVITGSGVACPVGDVPKSELEVLAARCLTGDLKAGDVPVAAPATVVEPETEAAPVPEAEESKGNGKRSAKK